MLRVEALSRRGERLLPLTTYQRGEARPQGDEDVTKQGGVNVKMDYDQIRGFCEGFIQRYRDAPSLRKVFYAFVDILWPNTKSTYKLLSRKLVAARKKGIIDWSLIADGAGRGVEGGDLRLWTPEEYAEHRLDKLRKAHEDFQLPVWYEQPNYVELWCEKEAGVIELRANTEDLGVLVVYNRGYPGWRFLRDNVERLQDVISKGREVTILYFGDFDPSGEDIARFAEEATQWFGVIFDFQKIAVTKDQIEGFKLPHRPEDAKEIEKLHKDSRFKKWPWGLYRVELDALTVRHPDEFRAIVREAVLRRFDRETYQQSLEKEKELKPKVKEVIDSAIVWREPEEEP